MFKGKLWPYQEEATERMTDRGQMLLGMVMGAGKEQPVSSLVATRNGFRPIGELLPGDLVITPDSGYTPVLRVYPQGVKDVYEVTFSDGSSARCGIDHLWKVQRVQGRSPKWQTLSLQELLSDGLIDSSGNRKWRIPMTEPVRWADRNTPVLDAYTLGLLLGDGSFRCGTPVFSSSDQELVDALVLPEGVIGRKKSKYDWRLSRVATAGSNPLTDALRSLGLWGLGSHNKFVPHSYLHGSVEDRLSVLQGVMDTDGTPTRGGGGELVTTSHRLAVDVAFLTESLGGSVRWGNHQHGHRLLVKLPQNMSVFRLTRKAGGEYTKYPVTRLLADVKLVGREECVCIKVRGGLYLTDHFVVTHNTPTTLGAVEDLVAEGEVERCLVVVPASLKFQWLREIAKFTDGRATVIDGSPPKRKQQWRTSMHSRYVIVNPETLINDVKLAGEFQCMVIDEATIIKNRRAKRSRLLKKVGKTIPYRFALTGQPIENRPEELFCADAETQILTKRGWLKHDRVTTEDWALTLNHTTGEAEWQRVQAVNSFEVTDQPVLSMESRDHSSLTSFDHRWPVTRWTFQDGKRHEQVNAWATSMTFHQSDVVPLAAPVKGLPSVGLLPDSLVELVAWVYTEGHCRKLRDGTPGTAVNISQNTGTEGALRIRAALTSLFGPESGPFPRLGGVGDTVSRWREDSDGHHSVFKLNTVAGAHLLSFAPDKVPSYKFLLNLSKKQLDLFVEVSMLADNNGSHNFSQKSEAAAEAFQFAQVLRGVPTSIRPNPKVDLDRQGNPYQMTQVTIRRKQVFRPYYSHPQVTSYTGVLWCPTTPNGTWFARRNGSTYFTGNSIMEFVDKDVLGSFEVFDRTFIVRDHWGKPLRYRNLDKMNKVMQECMVRKTREDIKDQLPDIIHQVIPVPFDPKGAHLYRTIANDLLGQIASAVKYGNGSFNLWAHYNDPAGNEAQGQIMARLTVLRMLCDNPALIHISSDNYQNAETKAGSQYANELAQAGHLDGVISAPKLNACLDYIEEVLAEDPQNKVVLFSFFKDNLRLIKEATKHLTASVLFMGGMSAEERDEAKQKFATDPNCRLFLSSDAGGYGVDLPMANYLISYDLPWSSGKLEQREARIIRLSSEFPHVTIATFVMQGSIEERQYEMLQHKKSVNEAFIDGKHLDKDHGLEITLDTLTNFLRESTV